MPDIPDEVRRLVWERLDVAEDRVKPEAFFIDDLGADSLALVELTLVFEEVSTSRSLMRRPKGCGRCGMRSSPSRSTVVSSALNRSSELPNGVAFGQLPFSHSTVPSIGLRSCCGS
jgi:hypothetical protein